jgi:hypothetical protein
VSSPLPLQVGGTSSQARGRDGRHGRAQGETPLSYQKTVILKPVERFCRCAHWANQITQPHRQAVCLRETCAGGLTLRALNGVGLCVFCQRGLLAEAQSEAAEARQSQLGAGGLFGDSILDDLVKKGPLIVHDVEVFDDLVKKGPVVVHDVGLAIDMIARTRLVCESDGYGSVLGQATRKSLPSRMVLEDGLI